MKLLLPVLLCLFVGLIGCSKQENMDVDNAQVPNWVTNQPSDGATIYAIGIGASLLEAIASGLGELTNKISVNVESGMAPSASKDVNKTVASVAFENLKVKSLVKTSVEKAPAGSSKGTSEMINSTVHFTYMNKKRQSLNFRMLQEESSQNGISSTRSQYDVQIENMEVWDLVHLLEEEGIKVARLEQQQKSTYLMLSIPKNVAEKLAKQPPEKKAYKPQKMYDRYKSKKTKKQRAN